MNIAELKAAIVAAVVRTDDPSVLQELAARLGVVGEEQPTAAAPPPSAHHTPARDTPVSDEPPLWETTTPTAHASSPDDPVIGYTIDNQPEHMHETLARWEAEYERAVEDGSLRSMEETYLDVMHALEVAP